MIAVIIVLSFILVLTGCGETLSGVSKDVKRVGKGVKTIFFRDTE